MTPWVFGVALVVLASVLEGLAQVSLKRTSIAVTAKARWATLAVSLFVIEALVYTAALHWLDISTAYPLGALSFIFVALFSRWLLNEAIDRLRWLGLALIVFGAGLVVLP